MRRSASSRSPRQSFQRHAVMREDRVLLAGPVLAAKEHRLMKRRRARRRCLRVPYGSSRKVNSGSDGIDVGRGSPASAVNRPRLRGRAAPPLRRVKGPMRPAQTSAPLRLKRPAGPSLTRLRSGAALQEQSRRRRTASPFGFARRGEMLRARCPERGRPCSS